MQRAWRRTVLLLVLVLFCRSVESAEVSFGAYSSLFVDPDAFIKVKDTNPLEMLLVQKPDFGFGSEALPGSLSFTSVQCGVVPRRKNGKVAKAQTDFEIEGRAAFPLAGLAIYHLSLSGCELDCGADPEFGANVGGGVRYLLVEGTSSGIGKIDDIFAQCSLGSVADFSGLSPQPASSFVDLIPARALLAFADGRKVATGGSRLTFDEKTKLRSSPTLSGGVIDSSGAEEIEVMVSTNASNGAKPVKKAKVKVVIEVTGEDGTVLGLKKVVLKTDENGVATKSVMMPVATRAAGQRTAIVATGTGKNQKRLTTWGLGVAVAEPPTP